MFTTQKAKKNKKIHHIYAFKKNITLNQKIKNY